MFESALRDRSSSYADLLTCLTVRLPVIGEYHRLTLVPYWIKMLSEVPMKDSVMKYEKA